VFSPQRGRELPRAYLTAADQTLGGDDGPVAGDHDDPDQRAGGFHYVKRVASGNHAVLEFETTMGPTVVNGVDIITCDDDALITEFKVMIRPLQAVNAVHEAMRLALERMAGEGA
jgi:hypothetical protein